MQSVEALIAAVHAATTKGDSRQALALSNQAIRQFPDDATTWALRGQLHFHNVQLAAAREDMERACKLRPDDQQLVKELSIVLESLEAYDDLQKLFQQAVERWPLDNDLLLTRAQTHTHIGNFQLAKVDYSRVLKRDPGNVGAISFMVMHGCGDEVGGLNGVEVLLTDQNLRGAERIALCYSRAHLLEQGERYDEAFEMFREANVLHAAAGGMNISAKQKGARSVINSLKKGEIERFCGGGNKSDRPVFIVGMPRSGTSLTEQILAAHPDVYAAGEQFFWGNILHGLITSAPRRGTSMVEAIDNIHPDVWRKAGTEYLRRMSEINAESARITDKMPTNFALIPYIRLIFPQARIIHLRRESLATLASCIRTPFAGSVLGLSVEDWARFYGMYEALMDQWRPILGKQLLEINYEELVSNISTEARRLISFLGLDWHEDCLHPESTKRAVRTASSWQVRQEVHTEAINSWRRYEAQLEALRPLIAQSRQALLSSTIT